MKIGIVFTQVNLWESMTLPAIQSVRSRHETMIIVVDNGSTGTNTPFHNAVTFIKNRNNFGVSYAWNQGAQAAFNAGCDYVLIANNDVLFHPETIDRLVYRFSVSKSKYYFVYDEGKLQYGEAVTPSEPANRDVLNNPDEPIAMITACNIHNECQHPQDIFTKDASVYSRSTEGEHPDFSAFMLSKEAYEKVGQFDEGFYPAYHEDNDYHRRIKLSGMIAINCPGAIYYHHGSATRIEMYRGNQLGGNMAFERTKGYFIVKWGGMPEADGSLGNRLFSIPFGDATRGLKWGLQDRCKGMCKHEPRCSDLYKKFGVDLSLI